MLCRMDVPQYILCVSLIQKFRDSNKDFVSYRWQMYTNLKREVSINTCPRIAFIMCLGVIIVYCSVLKSEETSTVIIMG